MKIDTNTILIGGAVAAGIYFLTRPRTPQIPLGYPGYQQPYNPYAPAYNPNQPSGTAQIISASGTALQGISDIIGHFFD